MAILRQFVSTGHTAIVLIVPAILVLGPCSVRAAEFQLRSQCRCRTAMVTLGDLAEIIAADRRQAATLAAMELFPAPSGSRQRFVGIREVQDLLLERGIALTEHRFSGSSQVAVLGGEPSRPEQKQPLMPADTERAELRIRQAVTRFLQQNKAAEHCTIEFTLGSDQVRLAAHPRNRVSIAGGTSPWTGSQRFEVTV